MKLRQLEISLEDVHSFGKPKLEYEQYATTAHLAACMLHTAETQFGDIEGRNVLDLGCGCGILSIGSAILGANFCLGIDIDQDALKIFQRNCADFELDNVVECLQFDVNQRNFNGILFKKFDTVVMNPPYGTKHNNGIDMNFLYAASKLSTTAVYSLHKTTTRNHVCKKANDFGMKAQVVAELKYNLNASYKFHTKRSKDIEVDFIRFSFI